VRVECLRVVDRLRLQHPHLPQRLMEASGTLESMLNSSQEVELSRTILARASGSMAVPVGTLDAIHLATAAGWRENSGEDLVVATHDATFGRAASALGFRVVGT